MIDTVLYLRKKSGEGQFQALVNCIEMSCVSLLLDSFELFFCYNNKGDIGSEKHCDGNEREKKYTGGHPSTIGLYQ